MKRQAVSGDPNASDRQENRENSTLVALVLAWAVSLLAVALFAGIKAASLGLV